ncbi:MAG TPA: glycosyltransferase, partial [Chthoniobacterales bacterium]
KNPRLDVSEPYTERVLRETIAAFRPDVIHVQELASLPSAVLEVVQQSGVPNLMTLQDYGPLCPVFRLYDYRGQVCLQRDVGHKCVPCCSALSGTTGHLLNTTWRYEIRRVLGSHLAKFVWKHKDSLRRLRAVLHRATERAPAAVPDTVAGDTGPPVADDSAQAYQARRDTAVARLQRMDLLIAQSTRVAEIYRALGVETDRLRTLNLTVDHLGRIKFRARTSIGSPLTFITLNGCAMVPKGASIMRDAFLSLAALVPENSFRLLIYGSVDPAARDLLALPQVEHLGIYHVRDLDRILEQAHVGIVPSIWEEAYGYTGIEMLAKGVPIIGNARGGIVDYLKPNVTGWLNIANTADGLAAILREVIEQPEQVLALNRKIAAQRSSLIKPMEVHRREMHALYEEAARQRATSQALSNNRVALQTT